MENTLDSRLFELKEKIKRKAKLLNLKKEIADSIKIERSCAEALEIKMEKEYKDVKRIEGKSLESLLFTLIGSREKRLLKEQEEFAIVSMKYDEAKARIAEYESELSGYISELEKIGDPEADYKAAFEEKEKWMKENCSGDYEIIVSLKNRKDELMLEKKELDEAFKAGLDVEYELSGAANLLRKAQNWSNIDMITDNIAVDYMKNSRINEAKSYINRAQTKMKRMKRELADINGAATEGMNIYISGAETFVDMFFDNIFTDFVVRNKISSSLDNITATERSVKEINREIKKRLDTCREAEEEIEKLITEKVENSITHKN